MFGSWLFFALLDDPRNLAEIFGLFGTKESARARFDVRACVFYTELCTRSTGRAGGKWSKIELMMRELNFTGYGLRPTVLTQQQYDVPPDTTTDDRRTRRTSYDVCSTRYRYYCTYWIYSTG